MGSQNRVSDQRYTDIKCWLEQHKNDYKSLTALDKAAADYFGISARTMRYVRNSKDYRDYKSWAVDPKRLDNTRARQVKTGRSKNENNYLDLAETLNKHELRLSAIDSVVQNLFRNYGDLDEENTQTQRWLLILLVMDVIILILGMLRLSWAR